MARLVHLARASSERSIVRSGLRGTKLLVVVSGESAPRLLARAVFAMPILPDFGVTYQWLRELRRWHGERMIAVHVRVPDDETVLVGRYGAPHDERAAAAAAQQIAAKPAGAEIVVPRGVPRSDVLAIRELTQLVGWTEVPEGDRKLDCVCPVCLPRGVRDRWRRLNAAYRRALDRYRTATSTDAKLEALARVDTVLGEARGRLDEGPLLRIARAGGSDVRQRASALLGGLPWSRVEAALTRLAISDEDPLVRSRAVGAVLRSAGPLRAARVLADAAERENETLLNVLGDELPTLAVATALGIVRDRHPAALASKTARVARKLLSELPDDPRAQALLARLSNGVNS